MYRKTIRLSNSALSGEWHYVSAHSRRRLIIVCHGYQGSSEDPSLATITSELHKSGHDTFTFDFSTNAGGFDIEHQVNDVAQVAKYFSSYKEIVLLAKSFGALTAAIAAIQMPQITGLITISGFFGEGYLGQEHRKNYIKFRIAALVVPKYRKILKYFKHELQPERITVPVLVIHSKADKYVFIEQSRHFYDSLKVPKRFIELQAATHGITAFADRKKVASAINGWLQGI